MFRMWQKVLLITGDLARSLDLNTNAGFHSETKLFLACTKDQQLIVYSLEHLANICDRYVDINRSNC